MVLKKRDGGTAPDRTAAQRPVSTFPMKNLNFSNVHGHWGAESSRSPPAGELRQDLLIENRRALSQPQPQPLFHPWTGTATRRAAKCSSGRCGSPATSAAWWSRPPTARRWSRWASTPHDCLLTLEPGQTLTAPAILCGYSATGFETMSHNLHRFALDHIMSAGLRPVLYNSWEATEFHVNCQDQIKAGPRRPASWAPSSFVLDDGWFGERHSIQNGLGDWYVNEGKFPNGLEELIDAVKGQGMKFGLWVEPEMVNPKAKLYQEPPRLDLPLRYPGHRYLPDGSMCSTSPSRRCRSSSTTCWTTSSPGMTSTISSGTPTVPSPRPAPSGYLVQPHSSSSTMWSPS